MIEASQDVRDAFAAMLEKSFETNLKPGSIVIGEILRLEKDGLLVDIGGKSEGFVPLKEVPGCHNYDQLTEHYAPHQVTEFFILQDIDNKSDGVRYNLSIRRVTLWKNWDRLQELKEAMETVEVTVTGLTKGGVIVNIMGFKGFIPASQLRVAKALLDMVGENLPARILEVDKKKNKLILSHREAVFAEKAKQRVETMKTIAQGDVVEGEVVKITDFGAFVDINGIDGLLPLSEITWRRIQHPSEVLNLGQTLTVRVLTVDKELQRISLSLKRLETDPWDTVNAQFRVGDVVQGRISKTLNSGVLAELTPGIEAYCAYEQNGPDFALNETHTFEIVSILPDERKITLLNRQG